MNQPLDLEQEPGRCAFCDDPLPRTFRRPRVTCGKRECIQAYHAEWYIQRRGGLRLREVVSFYGQPGDWHSRLSCGHERRAESPYAERHKKRRCHVCSPPPRLGTKRKAHP